MLKAKQNKNLNTENPDHATQNHSKSRKKQKLKRASWAGSSSTHRSTLKLERSWWELRAGSWERELCLDGQHMLSDKFAHAKVELGVHETINEGGLLWVELVLLPRPAKREQVQLTHTCTHTHTHTVAHFIMMDGYELFVCATRLSRFLDNDSGSSCQYLFPLCCLN